MADKVIPESQEVDGGREVQSTNEDGQNLQGKDGGQEVQSKVYAFEGRELTADEVYEEAKRLKVAFTQANQERAAASEEPQPSEDEQASIEQIADLLGPALEKRGYVKSDQAITKDELKLQSLLDRNPDLKGKEQEIRDLSSLPHNKGKAWEDIIATYGFSTTDKLAKARLSGDPVGFGSKADTQKSVSEMSPTEYADWKQAQGVTGKLAWQ